MKYSSSEVLSTSTEYEGFIFRSLYSYRTHLHYVDKTHFMYIKKECVKLGITKPQNNNLKSLHALAWIRNHWDLIHPKTITHTEVHVLHLPARFKSLKYRIPFIQRNCRMLLNNQIIHLAVNNLCLGSPCSVLTYPDLGVPAHILAL